MKTIIEDNFLSYRLEITVDPVSRVVLGTLVDTSYGTMGRTAYVAHAICADEDKFSEVKGIKLVKLKLARQIHNDALVAIRESIKETEKEINHLKRDLAFHTKKIEGINAVMKREFDRTIYKSKKTTAKKSVTKKTVKKSTKKNEQ